MNFRRKWVFETDGAITTLTIVILAVVLHFNLSLGYRGCSVTGSVPCLSTVAACRWTGGDGEMSVFTRISACWYMICAHPLPCFSGLLLFVRDTLSELLGAPRTLADGERRLGLMAKAPFTSCEHTATGRLFRPHTHLQTQGPDRQVNLKHTCKTLLLHNCCYTRRHGQPRLRADFQCYN